MTHDDPRDLSALLRGLADDAAHAPRARSLDDMAATARTHGLAARRRRTAARSLVAAASVAVVAVGGVLVAQNLGGDDGTPPPATTAPPPISCGTPFTAPKGTNDDLTLVPVDGNGPFTVTGLDDLPSVAAVLGPDSASPAESLGSTGYVTYTVVKDGLAVASGGAMPEPFTAVELIAGGGPGEAFSRTVPVPCDGGDTLPAGRYEVWATLDGSLLQPTDGRDPVTVVGGPWDVTIGGPDLTMDTGALECGTTSVPGLHSSAVDTYRLEAIGPDRPTSSAPLLPALLRLDPAVLDGSTQARTVKGVWVYLARDGKIVAAHKTEGRDLRAWFGADDATGIVPGTSQVVDGMRVAGSATACDGSGLLPAGDYEAWAVVEIDETVAENSETTTIIASEAVPVALTAPSVGTGSDASMLTCGDPTGEITSSTTAGGDKVTLTLEGTETRVAAGAVAKGAVSAAIRHAKGALDVLEGGPVEVYLLRDETVVSVATTEQPDGPWWTGPDVPTGDTTFRNELTADVSTSACDGSALPDGTYTLLVVVPVHVPETGDGSHELISVRQDIVVGDGEALPAADPSATFPACGALVPGYQGDPYEIVPLGDGAPMSPAEDDVFEGVWLPLTKLVSSSDTTQRVSYGATRGVLTRDGHVVGSVFDEDLLGGPSSPMSATLGGGRSAEATVATQFRSCGGDGSLPEGTYDVWGTLEVTGTAPVHAARTVVSKVATIVLGGATTSDLMCAAPLPVRGDEELAVTSKPVTATIGLEAAYGQDLRVTNRGDRTLTGNLPHILPAVLVKDGRIVSRVPDASYVGSSPVSLAPDASMAAAWAIDIHSCTTGDEVPAGTYEAWVGVTIALDDGSLASTYAKVGNLTVDPTKVTD
ncbi:hypothetical protein [Sanguibacter sp. HDW7]|uniref:hypothetical protein n=1 Tax=Sanguibacter sp. HDW7 TaxID=2714931 RepID=UPI00140B614D|nr:hypothetical protein [Sanguibacter sp. HDW7]QIK84439.1 hypothetical protein G7063_13055 [Sanguibacter sp. HDW7]